MQQAQRTRNCLSGPNQVKLFDWIRRQDLTEIATPQNLLSAAQNMFDFKITIGNVLGAMSACELKFPEKAPPSDHLELIQFLAKELVKLQKEFGMATHPVLLSLSV